MNRLSIIEDIARSRCSRPCKDCVRRFPLCHTSCEDYARYKEEYEAIKTELLLRSCGEMETEKYIMDRKLRREKEKEKR